MTNSIYEFSMYESLNQINHEKAQMVFLGLEP